MTPAHTGDRSPVDPGPAPGDHPCVAELSVPRARVMGEPRGPRGVAAGACCSRREAAHAAYPPLGICADPPLDQFTALGEDADRASPAAPINILEAVDQLARALRPQTPKS